MFKHNRPVKGRSGREKVNTLRELEEVHFGGHTDENHPCRGTLMAALGILQEKPSTIIETGSSAWGANSSLLFDLYVANFGGSFDSVDIRRDPSRVLSRKCSPKSRFWTSDSVSWLSNLASLGIREPDLVYLDSWDVDPLTPVDSAVHGLAEFCIYCLDCEKIL